jgi:hypothetical protein
VPQSAHWMGPTPRWRQEGPTGAVEFCPHAPFLRLGGRVESRPWGVHASPIHPASLFSSAACLRSLCGRSWLLGHARTMRTTVRNSLCGWAPQLLPLLLHAHTPFNRPSCIRAGARASCFLLRSTCCGGIYRFLRARLSRALVLVLLLAKPRRKTATHCSSAGFGAGVNKSGGCDLHRTTAITELNHAHASTHQVRQAAFEEPGPS